MITPLLTQLTYEGLIDELVGIKNCEHLLTCPPGVSVNHIISICGATAICACTSDRSRRPADCGPIESP